MVTKRQLGIGLLTCGLLGVVGVLLVDWVGAGEFSGFGPLQQLVLGVGCLVALLGASLIPLGDRPA